MKRDDVLLVIATLTLVELTLIAVIAYDVYNRVAPTVNGLEQAGTGIGGLWSLITGKPSTNPPA